MAADQSRIAPPQTSTVAGGAVRNVYNIGVHWIGANTSGLPMPKSSTRSVNANEPRSSPIQQQRAIPSTVGSALRRRQTSNIAQPHPSNLTYANQKRNAPATSTGSQVRGHQQQLRPPSMIGYLRQPSSSIGLVSPTKSQVSPPSTSFPAQLRLNPTVNSSSAGKHSSFIASPKTSSGSRNTTQNNDDVQLLAPLKSTRYIGHIATKTCDKSSSQQAIGRPSYGHSKGNGYLSSSSSIVSLASSQDIRSEPVASRMSSTIKPQASIGAQRIHTSCSNRMLQTTQSCQQQQQMYQSSQSISKPSQLVKPMPQSSATNSKISLKPTNTAPTSRLQAPQISTRRQVNKPAPQLSGVRQSKLPSTKPKEQAAKIVQPLNASQTTGVQTNPNLSGVNAQPSLRYGLQPTKRSTTLSSQASIRQVENKDSTGDMKSVSEASACSYLTPDEQLDENDCDNFVDANDENVSDDESEDDATTATTMTNTSDSNDPMRKASRELDNMIQMLTSSSVKSELLQAVPKEATKIGSVMLESGKREPASTRGSASKAEAVQSSSATASTKRCHNNVLKSHSVSFSKTQQVACTDSLGRADDHFRLLASTKTSTTRSALPRRSCSIKSARPRSRIIFDPTSSQFHVSCTTEPERDSSTSTSSDDDDSNTLPTLTSGRKVASVSESSEEDDGSDRSQGSGCINLPKLTAQSDEYLDEGIDESSRKLLEAQNKIRLLKPLPVLNDMDTEGEPNGSAETESTQLPPKCPTKNARRCQSPVGSALRSLFGLNGASAKTGTGTAGIATGTIMRHSSLRAKMNPELQKRDTQTAQLRTGSEVVKKSNSIDSASAPLTLIDYCNYGTSRQVQKSALIAPQTRIKPRTNDLCNSALELDSSSRSYVPGFEARLRLSQPKTRSPAIARLKSTRGHNGSSDNMADNDEDDDDDDDDDYVEVLPPLKSESYISRLSTGHCRKDHANEDTDLRTISSSSMQQLSSIGQNGTNTKRNYSSCSARYPLQPNAQRKYLSKKPSQLVRPILQRNSSASHFDLNPSSTSRLQTPQASATDTSSRLQSASEQKSNLRSPVYSSRSSHGYTTSIKAPATSRLGEAAPRDRIALEEDSRRLSLQYNQPVASSNARETNEEPNTAGKSNRDELGSSGDDYASDFDDTMQKANQELDSVMQMLTSRSTSYERNSSPREDTRTETDTDELGGNPVAAGAPESLRESLIKNPRKLSVKRRQNSILKSQSLSFGGQQQQGASVLGRSADHFRTLASTTKKDDQRSALPRRSSSIKSARPRSRIIFDPTSSQFHVSCTTEPDSCTSTSEEDEEDSNTLPDVATELTASRKDSLTISSEEEDISADPDELGIAGNIAADEQKQSDDNSIDNSSMKLLEAQSKIISLKHLPVETSEFKEENQPASALQAKAQTTSSDALPPKCPVPIATNKARCRSPVGSALRSLFGLKGVTSTSTQSQIQTTSSALPASLASPSSTKVATVVRHSSLRFDPRPLHGNIPSIASPPPMQPNASFIAHSPVPKSTSVDGTTAPLSSIDNYQHQKQRQVYGYGLGSDLLQRAGKRLSASSSSLTSRFRSIASTATTGATTTFGAQRLPQPMTASGPANVKSSGLPVPHTTHG